VAVSRSYNVQGPTPKLGYNRGASKRDFLDSGRAERPPSCVVDSTFPQAFFHTVVSEYLAEVPL